MLGAVTGTFLVLIVAASAPAAQVGAVVDGTLPDFEAITLGALPPPPEKAVLVTQSFGTVTVDHRAHLARRIACRNCHGPGVVGKFGRLPPPVAHQRCVTCHREHEHAPTKCRECHVVAKAEPSPAQTLANASPSQGTGGPAQPPATAPTHERRSLAALVATRGADAPALAVASAGTPVAMSGRPAAPGPESLDTSEPPTHGTRSMRTLDVGYGGFLEDGGSGPSVAISMRSDEFLMVYAFERDLTESRMLGFLGIGAWRPLYRGWNLLGAVVGGFGVGGATATLAPLAGLRVGTEYLWRRTSVGLAVTGASYLSGDGAGHRPGDIAMSYMASVGYVIGTD